MVYQQEGEATQMAHLIQLEAYTGGADIFHEIWINADQIVGIISGPTKTRIYLSQPILPVSVTSEAESWIDVRESPKQIREQVVAERAMGRGWLSRRKAAR